MALGMTVLASFGSGHISYLPVSPIIVKMKLNIIISNGNRRIKARMSKNKIVLYLARTALNHNVRILADGTCSKQKAIRKQ